MTEQGPMPLLANDNSSPLFRRVVAGIEALMLAGVVYLVASDQQRKEDMIILKTTSNITAQAVQNIPDLTIRMVKAEGDIMELKRRVGLNEDGIEDIKDKERLK